MEIFAITSHILSITLAMLMGVVCGLFSYFLDYCFWNKSIFKKWLPFLTHFVTKKFYREQREIIIKNVNELFFNKKDSDKCEADKMMLLTELAEKNFFYMVLGGCAVCMNVYFAFISWIVIMQFDPEVLFWYHFFPYALTSSWLIRKLTKTTY